MGAAPTLSLNLSHRTTRPSQPAYLVRAWPRLLRATFGPYIDRFVTAPSSTQFMLSFYDFDEGVANREVLGPRK